MAGFGRTETVSANPNEGFEAVRSSSYFYKYYQRDSG